jgi:hypothetical protein
MVGAVWGGATIMTLSGAALWRVPRHLAPRHPGAVAHRKNYREVRIERLRLVYSFIETIRRYKYDV